MRVYNLTDQRVDYRGKLISPYGSEEYDLGFIPDRDLKLAEKKMLAFGSLPKGWRKPEPKPEPPSAIQQVAKMAAEVIHQGLEAPGFTRQVLKATAVEAEPKEDVKVEEKVETSFKKKKSY